MKKVSIIIPVYNMEDWVESGIKCITEQTYENLEIHHIEPLTVKWEKRLQNDNLITLCVQCHRFVDRCNNGNLDFEWETPYDEFNFEFR